MHRPMGVYRIQSVRGGLVWVSVSSALAAFHVMVVLDLTL